MGNGIGSIQKLESVEWFIIAEDARITSPTFKVIIPKLTSGIGSCSEPVEQDITINNTGLLNTNTGAQQSFKNSNTFTVPNMTDYRLEHIGHMEMESIKIKSMKQGTTSGVTELAGPGPHDHVIKKELSSKDITGEKISGQNIRLYDLNRPIVSKGTKVLGVCINGNINDMGVIHIPGAVKLGAEKSSESLGADTIGGK